MPRPRRPGVRAYDGARSEVHHLIRRLLLSLLGFDGQDFLHTFPGIILQAIIAREEHFPDLATPEQRNDCLR